MKVEQVTKLPKETRGDLAITKQGLVFAMEKNRCCSRAGFWVQRNS